MNNFAKLFKFSFKNNRKIFILFNILTFIAYTISVLTVHHTVSSYSLATGNITDTAIINIGDSLFYPSFLAILVSSLLFIAYVFISLYLKFSNSDGTLYTRMTLPVRRNSHLLVILIEGLIFIAIQYVLINIMLNLNYQFILNEFKQIDNVNMFKILDHFQKDKTYMMYISNFKMFSLSITNIAIRFLVTWPIVILTISLFYLLFRKFGKIVFLIIVALFILQITLGIKYYDSWQYNIPYHVLDYIFNCDYAVKSKRKILEAVILNISVLIALVFTNCYLFRKKIDF